MVVGDTIIRAGELQAYCDETFWHAMELWGLSKVWGLANGDIGWGNEPLDYILAITTLESESNAVQMEEMEERQAKMRADSPKSK